MPLVNFEVNPNYQIPTYPSVKQTIDKSNPEFVEVTIQSIVRKLHEGKYYLSLLSLQHRLNMMEARQPWVVSELLQKFHEDSYMFINNPNFDPKAKNANDTAKYILDANQQDEYGRLTGQPEEVKETKPTRTRRNAQKTD